MPMFIARCCHRCSLLISLVDGKILEDKGLAVSGLGLGLVHGSNSETCWGNIWDTRSTQTQGLFVNFLYSSWNSALMSSLKHTRHLRGRENKVYVSNCTFPISFPKDPTVLGSLPTFTNSTGAREQTQRWSPGLRVSWLSDAHLALMFPGCLGGYQTMKNVYLVIFKGERIRFI